MNVRAKFKCVGLNKNSYNPSATQYNFTAVGADGVPENQRYHKYTPNGDMNITVDNPAVEFVLGKTYYLDFSEAE